MADKSAIEWTDATWNPIVGCSIVSPGCTHCYAMGMAGRIEAMTKAMKAKGQTGAPHYDGTTRKVNGNTIWTGKVALAPDHILLEPLTWRAPRRIFVNSMGDLFHEDVPDEWIDKVFAVMALAPQHTFQVLTKRAKRMREYVSPRPSATGTSMQDRLWSLYYAMGGKHPNAWPLPNVWLGVSTERQQEANERIPELLSTPAAVRFVSAEPLLGQIDFYETSAAMPVEGHPWKNGPILQGIHWIIVGGESGPNARPMHPAWARSIRDQCAAAGVPFFFKQWGAWLDERYATARGMAPGPEMFSAHGEPKGNRWHFYDSEDRNGDTMIRVGKKAAGRLLDGVEHNAMPVVS